MFLSGCIRTLYKRINALCRSAEFLPRVWWCDLQSQQKVPLFKAKLCEELCASKSLMGRGGSKREDTKRSIQVFKGLYCISVYDHLWNGSSFRAQASHGLHVVNISAVFLVEKHVTKISTTGIEMKPICSLQCIREMSKWREDHSFVVLHFTGYHKSLKVGPLNAFLLQKLKENNLSSLSRVD